MDAMVCKICERREYITQKKDLIKACREGDIPSIQTLLADPRVDPSDQDNSAIRWASLNGRLEVVRLLLADPRVDPSALGNEAIKWACKEGNIPIVQALLSDPRVDPSDQDNQAVVWASGDGDVGVVRLLLVDPRVDPSDLDNAALRRASKMGHLGMVRLLLADPRVDLLEALRSSNPLESLLLKLELPAYYRRKWRVLSIVVRFVLYLPVAKGLETPNKGLKAD